MFSVQAIYHVDTANKLRYPFIFRSSGTTCLVYDAKSALPILSSGSHCAWALQICTLCYAMLGLLYVMLDRLSLFLSWKYYKLNMPRIRADVA